MVILYELTIFANLALLAIIIAIFVFASSIHGGASKISAEEEESLLARRRERIEEVKESISKEMNGVDGDRFIEQLKATVVELNNDLKKIDRAILEARNKGKALTLRNLVAIPSSVLLVSIIASGVAIAASGTLPTVMWILSLALIVFSLGFIYRNLRVVERFTSVTDLSTVIQQALETREMKSKPVMDVGKDMRQEVASVLRTLPPKESRIIEMYFGIGFERISDEEIAEEFGVKESTIVVTLARALRMSRHPSRSRRLRDYLDNMPVTGEKTGEQLFIEGIFGI